LIAFGEAVLDMVEDNLELLIAAEAGGERFNSAPYAIYRLHMTLLLRDADPDCDAEYLAETLLACLGADLYLYLREAREMGTGRLKQGWRELVGRIVPAVAEPALGR